MGRLAGWLVAVGLLTLILWQADRARRLRADLEAANLHADSIQNVARADSVDRARRDSVATAERRALTATLDSLAAELEADTGRVVTLLDTVYVSVPDSVRPVIDRMRRALERERRTWREIVTAKDSIIASFDRQLAESHAYQRQLWEALHATDAARQICSDAAAAPHYSISWPDDGPKLAIVGTATGVLGYLLGANRCN